MNGELTTIEKVVKSIVGEDCNYQLDLVHKTFMVECEEPIPQEQIDKICGDVFAVVSLRNFKGNIVFFLYL